MHIIVGTDDHLTIAHIMNNSARVYHILERNDEALVKLEKAVLIYQKIFGTIHHTYIADLLKNTASINIILRKKDKALANYGQVLAIYRNKFGTDEQLFNGFIFEFIVSVNLDLKKYDLALFNYENEKLFEIYKKEFGTEKHPSIAVILNIIGLIRYEKALENYEKSEEIFKIIKGTVSHELTGQSYA